MVLLWGGIMSKEKGGFKPEEVEINRHYWFIYKFENIEIECVIKVVARTGNFIFGRILDTQSLVIFFSRYRPTEDDPDEPIREYEELEVLVEHLIREVSDDELKALVGLVEMSTKDFFNVEPPIGRRFLN
jgi:hypothetical protein